MLCVLAGFGTSFQFCPSFPTSHACLQLLPSLSPMHVLRVFPRQPDAYLFLSCPPVPSQLPILHIPLSLLLHILYISMDEIHPSWLWEDSQPVEDSETMDESLLAEDSLVAEDSELYVEDSELAYGGVLPAGGALADGGVLPLAMGGALHSRGKRERGAKRGK